MGEIFVWIEKEKIQSAPHDDFTETNKITAWREEPSWLLLIKTDFIGYHDSVLLAKITIAHFEGRCHKTRMYEHYIIALGITQPPLSHHSNTILYLLLFQQGLTVWVLYQFF